MHAVITMALKDLRLLVRDRFGLFWILVFPLLYALFFGAIFGGSGAPGARALAVAVVDEDDSEASRALVERLSQSASLKVQALPLDEARAAVRKGNLAAYVVLPRGFARTSFFAREGEVPALQVGIDPSRRAEAGYLQGLLTEAVFAGMQRQMTDPKQFQRQIGESMKSVEQAPNLDPKVRQDLESFLGKLGRLMGEVRPDVFSGGPAWKPVSIATVEVTSDRVRPHSSFEVTFPSSILWGILGCVTTFAISLMTERREGTLLRLQIAPVSWGQVLAGKGLACYLSCAGVTVLLLLVGRLVLGVRLGNAAYLALAVASLALCFVGLMMLISTLGKTEQGVAGAGWGLMMPLAMLGGGMVPLIAMPPWLLTASNFSPVKWGIYALEGAIWRGFTMAEMLPWCGLLAACGVACFALGVWRLQKTAV